MSRATCPYKSGGTTFTDVGFTYGSATINDNLSRVATVTVGSTPTTVASYDYLGADHLVGTTLDQAQLNTSVFTESGGAHTYSDIDDFNRPKRWNWERIGGASGGFYNVQIAYDQNSNPIYTLDDVHIRASTSKHLFDVVYTLDNLNRVIGADEGHATGTPPAIQSSYHTRNELWNSLTLTGNWKNRQLDINGDGDFTDADDRNEPSADQAFNKANEWTDRKIAKAGTDNDDYDYTYDAVGNLTQEDITITRSGSPTENSRRGFVYDAFGRMVQTTGLMTEEGPTIVQNHRYNGLNFHIMEQSDTDLDGTLEDGERRYFMFDERWRIVGSFLDTSGAKEAFVNHAAGAGGFGGASYIDSVILRDRDVTGDSTLEERRYLCQNWRADVVALTKSDGTPLEYTRYSSYGEATVYSVADLNMDGVVNTTDSNEWDYLYGGTPVNSAYANADIGFDGSEGTEDGDLFSESYTANSGLSGKGRVSTREVGNRIGYAGYRWDGVVRAYECRYRWYFAEIGMWGRRDQVGYDGNDNLYSYVSLQSCAAIDPYGLKALLTYLDDADPLNDMLAVSGGQISTDPNGSFADPEDNTLWDQLAGMSSCMVQCMLGMTDNDISYLIQDMMNDPSNPSAVREVLWSEWDKLARQGLAKWVMMIKWIKIVQGRGVVGSIVRKGVKKGSEVLDADAIYRIYMKNIVKRLTKKVGGKAAAKIGGKFIPGVGWVLVGLDAYETGNCAVACEDGKYDDEEVPYIGVYESINWLLDPLLDGCGL